jgi:hypothetical protein
MTTHWVTCYQDLNFEREESSKRKKALEEYSGRSVFVKDKNIEPFLSGRLQLSILSDTTYHLILKDFSVDKEVPLELKFSEIERILVPQIFEFRK